VLQVDSAAPFTVEAHPLPRLAADTARIPEARFHTRVVSDGARLCEARIGLQHRGPLRWRFSLPKDSELLTCEVNGRASNPIVVANGQLELVVAPETSADSPARSEITFSFTARGPALAPVEGKLELTLPGTPLFIEDVVWTLDLPETYEATAFEGNAEPDGGGGGITFHKHLVRNEAASVEIYYRKRNSNL